MKRVVAIVTVALMATLPFALTACGMKKNDASAEGGAAAASASAAAVDTSASSSAATASDTPPAAVAMAPAANIPGVVTDPNGRPATESDDSAAKAEISKANYKKEIDRLEKEDLAQDKK